MTRMAMLLLALVSVSVPVPPLVRLPAVPEPLKFEIAPLIVALVVVATVSVRPTEEFSER